MPPPKPWMKKGAELKTLDIRKALKYQWIGFVFMVGVRGFEPPAPASRRQCSTKLSYTPMASLGEEASNGPHFKKVFGDFHPL